jgi:hypothetical protein
VIEKETLAVLFGCNRFSQYITVQPVTVKTDQIPQEKIFRKPLLSGPKGCSYRSMYTLKVNYIKGKHQCIADYLSRKNKGTDDYEEKQCDEEIYFERCQ